MTGWKKHLSSVLAVAVLAVFSAGCSDGADSAADQRPKPLTKDEVREAVRDGVSEASKPRWSVSEEEMKGMREHTKGYSLEDEERKKVEAQKKYEELQQRREREKAEATRESDR